MPFTNPKGRDWGSLVNWDGLGKLYAAFTIAWTLVLCTSCTWLILNRNRYYFVKFRNIWLGITATALLHVYLIKILLAYTTNGHFNCVAEFWIMSIYLPFGIAFFQANMAQLSSVSELQRRNLSSLPSDDFREQFSLEKDNQNRSSSDGPGHSHGIMNNMWDYWHHMTALQRTQILISAGVFAQVCVTLAVYLASRKFHESWGITGHYTSSAAKCRQGWEWFPSAFWQMVWTWIYGPYALYKIRNIRDIHYWKLTTVVCIIAGLPGTPLWIAALYSTAFKPVNKFWVPPMWLAPGIVVMQFCTVVVPILEAYLLPRRWETRSGSMASSLNRKNSTDKTGSSLFTTRHDSVGNTKDGSTSTLDSYNRRDIYSMAALEKTLAVNATPLLHFAATRDFTGENIVFLLKVRQWRSAWNYMRSTQDQQHLFHTAVDIFRTAVSPKTADFPINIAGSECKKLEAILGASTQMGDAAASRTNLVDPFNQPQINLGFDFESSKAVSLGSIGRSSSEPDSIRSIHGHRLSQNSGKVYPKSVGAQPLSSVNCSNCEVEPAITIPSGFDEHIFDEAEKAVKYSVVTNTWPRYINAHKEQNKSKDIVGV